jgi:hypothetical protein
MYGIDMSWHHLTAPNMKLARSTRPEYYRYWFVLSGNLWVNLCWHEWPVCQKGGWSCNQHVMYAIVNQARILQVWMNLCWSELPVCRKRRMITQPTCDVCEIASFGICISMDHWACAINVSKWVVNQAIILYAFAEWQLVNEFVLAWVTSLSKKVDDQATNMWCTRECLIWNLHLHHWACAMCQNGSHVGSHDADVMMTYTKDLPNVAMVVQIREQEPMVDHLLPSKNLSNLKHSNKMACCSKIQLICIQFFKFFLDIVCHAGYMYCLWLLIFCKTIPLPVEMQNVFDPTRWFTCFLTRHSIPGYDHLTVFQSYIF